MPRRPRIHAPGAFYHVTLRGNHRQPIFFCDEDRGLLSNIVSATIVRLGARVHAYCWMENHIHLLVQVGDVPLGRSVLRIASSYARTVQARLETTGHLFERRYHAVLVDADRYLLTLLRYIHLNPVRAGLVRCAVDYPWSSHGAYLGRRPEPWVTTHFALRMLGRDRREAVRRYRALVDGTGRDDTISPLEQLNAADPRVLGDDDFIRCLNHDVAPTRTPTTIEQLIEEACLEHGVAPSDLLSGSRQRHLTRVRAWLVDQALARHVATLSEMARCLGRDESTVRELVSRHHSSRVIETPETPDPAPKEKAPCR